MMFYIAYKDVDSAYICLATSKNGYSNWIESTKNPIIVSSPTPASWNADACYKPTILVRNKKIYIWYNGRKGTSEYIGLRICDLDNLF